MNHFYQVIRSNNLFVIHEYMYRVRSNNSMAYDISEFSSHMRKIPDHFIQLETIRGSDKTVKDAADIK